METVYLVISKPLTVLTAFAWRRINGNTLRIFPTILWLGNLTAFAWRRINGNRSDKSRQSGNNRKNSPPSPEGELMETVTLQLLEELKDITLTAFAWRRINGNHLFTHLHRRLAFHLTAFAWRRINGNLYQVRIHMTRLAFSPPSTEGELMETPTNPLRVRHIFCQVQLTAFAWRRINGNNLVARLTTVSSEILLTAFAWRRINGNIVPPSGWKHQKSAFSPPSPEGELMETIRFSVSFLTSSHRLRLKEN